MLTIGIPDQNLTSHKSALDAAIYSHWSRQEPIVVYDLHQHSSFEMKIWSLEYFKQNYSDERAILINCRENDQLQKSALKDFWLGFSDYDQRYHKSSKKPPIYKLKGAQILTHVILIINLIQDWPTTDDICKKMPLHFKAFKEFLPCHEICQRNGALNLAKYLPKYFCIPDLGPKMYIAYGWLEEFIDKSKQEIFMKMKQVIKTQKNILQISILQGSTDCHIDISGAVNIMTNVVEPINSFTERQRSDALRNLLVEGGLSDEEIQNFAESGRKPGALWHIWPVRDTEKIRKLLHKQDEEQYEKESGNDVIHDQDTYITSDIRLES